MATTESASARYADIEDWSTAELVDGILEGQFAAIAAVQAARASIATAIDAMTERLSAGGRHHLHGRRHVGPRCGAGRCRAAPDLQLAVRARDHADGRRLHGTAEGRRERRRWTGHCIRCARRRAASPPTTWSSDSPRAAARRSSSRASPMPARRVRSPSASSTIPAAKSVASRRSRSSSIPARNSSRARRA